MRRGPLMPVSTLGRSDRVRGLWLRPMRQPAELSPADADLASAAAERVVTTHRRLAEFLKAGLTLARIDAFIAIQLADLGCRSCFLGYRVPKSPPFPSHACLSLNECIVHGTAGYHTAPIVPGDLLKIDVGVVYRGWIGDAAWTYSFGEPTPEVRRLMDVGKESLRRGVLELRPGNTYIQWARTVQGYAEGECGFHLARGLGGHGYGRHLHTPPYISNVVPTWPGEWPDAHAPCEPGTLVAVEPMIAIGTGKTVQAAREWPIRTADGSMSVHYEHDVLITDRGPRILTHGLEDLPDVMAG
ncbi:MAG: M24 family metallopeptidase [Phycisphaerae bacterium]|nr:M24 family metallopeptidase [Phycisphaerae bacterium]